MGVARWTKQAAFTLAAIVAVSFALACAWVKPTSEGGKVMVATPSEVSGCEKLGTTTVSVLAKVGIVDRSEKKVSQELTALARNEAGGRGANVVLPLGHPEEGRQRFEIYSCSAS